MGTPDASDEPVPHYSASVRVSVVSPLLACFAMTRDNVNYFRSSPIYPRSAGQRCEISSILLPGNIGLDSRILLFRPSVTSPMVLKGTVRAFSLSGKRSRSVVVLAQDFPAQRGSGSAHI